MTFNYFPVTVEAIPREGETEPDNGLVEYAAQLDRREPVRSTFLGERLTDNTLLHQVFALKLQEGDSLASKVSSSPAAIHHRKKIVNGEEIWVPLESEPAALIYEVSGLGFLGIRSTS